MNAMKYTHEQLQALAQAKTGIPGALQQLLKKSVELVEELAVTPLGQPFPQCKCGGDHHFHLAQALQRVSIKLQLVNLYQEVINRGNWMPFISWIVNHPMPMEHSVAEVAILLCNNDRNLAASWTEVIYIQHALLLKDLNPQSGYGHHN